MTIEIDDAGTGDLVGDAFIIFWRRERNDLTIKPIPLEIYQTPDFDAKAKKHVQDMFVDALKELDIPITEEINLCTGQIFDLARQYLKEKGYNVKDAKIEGFLQDTAEETYVESLVEEYDVPEDTVTTESGRDRFISLFKWVAEDYPRRKNFVKTGFEKWGSKWEIEAKEKWMHQMVQTSIEEPTREPSGEGAETSGESKTRSHSRSRSFHGRKKTTSRDSARRDPHDRAPHPYNRRGGGRPKGSGGGNGGSGGRPDRRRGPSRGSGPRDDNKHYSSTDPNPRKFLY